MLGKLLRSLIREIFDINTKWIKKRAADPAHYTRISGGKKGII
jgi:hypothetical protein